MNRICTSISFFYLFISGSTASPLCSRIRFNWSYALVFLRPRLNETKYPDLSASVSTGLIVPVLFAPSCLCLFLSPESSWK